MVGPLVIFDIGSTLVTGPPLGPARRIAALTGAGEEAIEPMHRLLMTSDFAGPDEVADALVEIARVGRAELLAAVESVWDSQRTDARALPGAPDVLETLAGDGARLALLSDIWPPYLESVRGSYGDLFDRYIPSALQLFSFREGVSKPSTELVGVLLNRARRAPDNAVMVGDSYHKDIAPAAALGLGTVLIRPITAKAQESPLATQTLSAVAGLNIDLIRTILSRPLQESPDASPR